MARKVHLRLTGQAEKFVEEMERQGLNDRDIFAKALGLLEVVWRTRRVGLIRADVGPQSRDVEYFFGIQIRNIANEDEGPSAQSPMSASAST